MKEPPYYPFKLEYGNPENDESCLIDSSEESPIPFYSDQVFFIAPFFVIDRKARKAMTVKVSLEDYIKDNQTQSNMLLSLVSRRNNKTILVTLLSNMVINKRLHLHGISKCFNKLNSVYKQAGQERAQVKKMLEETTQGFHYEKLPIFTRENMMSS